MKRFNILLLIFMALLVAIQTTAVAGDYDWVRNFNTQAQADPSGFRKNLATRFKIGDLQVKTVLSNVDHPSDAYMILRLGEMSGRPTDYVMDKYSSGKKKGWGALAKSLGIKPGSQEFHALKRGHDLHEGYNRTHSRHGNSHQDYIDYDESAKGKKGNKNKGKGKGKEKSKKNW